ncbi:MAG: hypothetical protein RMY16_26005 [Nostoc sp. DedQUE12b]|nr:hypothetical protein [Nostoc sp. DedQUE12b]
MLIQEKISTFQAQIANDYEIEITEEEAEKLTVQIVTHEISKEELPAILKNYVINLI